MHTTIGGVSVRSIFLSDRRVSAPTSLIDDPVQLDESSKACFGMIHIRSLEYVALWQCTSEIGCVFNANGMETIIYHVSRKATHQFVRRGNTERETADDGTQKNDTLLVPIL